MKNIVEEILKIEMEGTNLEKQVARYIINYSIDYCYISATEIAKNCFVSNAFITKFAKKLGYNTFNNLKIELQNSQKILLELNQSENYMINQYANDILNTIIATVDQINNEELEEISEKIARAKRIFIGGIGGSGIVARDLRLKLYKLGLNVFYETDEHLQLFQENLIVSKQVVYIVISYSGPSQNQLAIIKRMRQKGVYTVIITGNNQLFNTDKQIIVKANESLFRERSVTSRVALNTITDLITIKTSLKVKSFY